MKYTQDIREHDEALASALKAFVPDEIFDIHAHPYHAGHFPSGAWPFLEGQKELGCAEHRAALLRYMPVKKIHGLYFGLPHRMADREAMNQWVAEEVRREGTQLSRALMVVSPEDDPKAVAEALRKGLFCGLKVYHCYAARTDTMHASIREYVPEWMWEILHEMRGVLMLHIVRDEAIADAVNQQQIRELSRKYPGARIILAHVARSFNYRHARKGLAVLEDLDNVVVDTSAVGEAEAFRVALRRLGPQRVLWGSDFAVSEMRGRCVSTGSRFFWLHPEVIDARYTPPTGNRMTLVGLESLVALQEVCEDEGVSRRDVEDIFFNNARRLLRPHLSADEKVEVDGPSLWNHAREVISGGTGLLSKRKEMFGTTDWPSYFSRCSGCEVWDLHGRRFIDFAGGIGAVLLGYADDDITRAVRRRLNEGTYCSLASPQEVQLADKLLSLHSWAGKVRYARGGGEAMSVAVRIARSATGRSGIAFCGYHGWHDWYLAANLGDNHALDGHLLPGLSPKGVPRELKGTAVPFRYNDVASFEQALQELGDNLAAVVMEPMRSEEPKNDFLRVVAERCRQKGAVFVGDEITSGLRYGFPGAFTRMEVEPDIVVYGKAMGNGFPFAAIVGKELIMRSAEDSFISSSYWTDGVGPAAALAVLEKMERLHVYDVLWKRGQELQSALRELSAKHPACCLDVGSMPVSPTFNFRLGTVSPLAKAFFTAKMLERGFLVSSVVYLMHAHAQTHISAFLFAVEATLTEMEDALAAGTLDASGAAVKDGIGFARLA